MVEINDKGQSVVVIDNIVFKGKRAIDWHSVEVYAQRCQERLGKIYLQICFTCIHGTGKYRKI